MTANFKWTGFLESTTAPLLISLPQESAVLVNTQLYMLECGTVFLKVFEPYVDKNLGFITRALLKYSRLP